MTERARLVDLSHTIEDGMITYRGLPAPLICDHLSRVASRSIYSEGTEFQIGRIELVGNTGTYLDTPYHRYAEGEDLSAVGLDRLCDLPGLVVDATQRDDRALDVDVFASHAVAGCAVLVHTGWDAHWRTDQYFEGHPFLTGGAARWLRDHGARLVGIDSFNIDSIDDLSRPVHTTLLGAGIPIVEHMTHLGALPATGFRFTAAPPKIRQMGTFPVRAFATMT